MAPGPWRGSELAKVRRTTESKIAMFEDLRVNCAAAIRLCFFVFLFLGGGCGNSLQSEQSQSGLEGTLGPASRSFGDLRARWTPAESALVTKMSRSVARLPPGGKSGGARQAFIREMADVLGESPVPPDLVHRSLRRLVDDGSTLCGGKSCARVLGFEKRDVGPFMDETAQTVLRASFLAKPEHRARRSQIAASLAPHDPRLANERIVALLSRKEGLADPLTETCFIPTQVAFGLRSNPKPFFLPGSISEGQRSLDFRSSAPKSFQGNTGACHFFAFSEMLKNLRTPEASALRKIDIERTFVEIWARSMGQNLTEGLTREVEKIRFLGTRVLMHVRNAKVLGQSEEEARAMWSQSLEPHWRMSDQAGNAKNDFKHLYTHGAVIRNTHLPALTIADIEDITTAIMNARMGLIRRMILQDEVLDETIVANAMVEPMRRLFAVVMQTTEVQRAPVRDEIRKFGIMHQAFDKKNLKASIDQFMKEFAKRGPLYVSANRHATTVVGYDAKARIFYIRDSADPLRRDYTPVDFDEFFNYLVSYSAVYPLPQR